MTDAKTTPDDLHIAPRDIRFDLASAHEGHWLGGDPVGTAVFNALSLTFPDGERLFMDAVKNYRHLLTGKLLEDAKGFLRNAARNDVQFFIGGTISVQHAGRDPATGLRRLHGRVKLCIR